MTLENLRTGAMPWDERVPTTPGIDPWCTCLAWQLSVHAAFGARHLSSTEPDETLRISDPLPGTAPPDEGLFVATRDWSLALRTQRFDRTNALVPLDAVWGFASPFVLTNGAAESFQIQQWADEMGEVLLLEPDWELAFLTGLEPGSPLDDAILRSLSPHIRLVGGERSVRCVASLEGGVDGFLSRRSRTFRRNLRQASARAKAKGLTIESIELGVGDPLRSNLVMLRSDPVMLRSDPVMQHSDPVMQHSDPVMQRLIAIERNSWKGQEDSGITSPDMARLYAGLLAHLGPVGGIRLRIARFDDADVGFILGGVIDGRYRGFQLSFTESVRTLSVGNLLQWHEVQNLCQEDVHTYDLGMDMGYKRAWGESEFVTRPIIAVRQ